MKIGIAFDLAPAPSPSLADGPDDRFEEFDKPETVAAIAAAIRAEGHDVALLGDGRDFLARVLADPPDFVFNIAEGEGVGRCREARVPAALEMLGIPYSGSDPLTLALCLDKGLARTLAAGSAWPVAVPSGAALDPGFAHPDLVHDFVREACRKIGGRATPDRPLLLKPSFEGSSKGVRSRCLVESEGETIAVFRELAQTYRQPILFEEFIAGDEVTVGIVGNDVVGKEGFFSGAMRIVPKENTGRFVYSLEVKRDWANQVSYETPPRLPAETLKRIVEAAGAVRLAFDIKDFARIDFRVRDGVPYFIEANPLPGLAPGVSDLVILAEGYGIGHAELIRMILRAALDRVGLR